MRLLTLESRDLDCFINGELVDPFKALEVKSSLIHIHLVSEEINYDTGNYKLVFDLDRTQEVPNFSDPHRVV